MTNNESKVKTANWYGHGTDAGGRIEDVYKKNRAVPKTVWIEGRYMADGEDLTIAQKVDATDVVGDFLRQKLSSFKRVVAVFQSYATFCNFESSKATISSIDHT